MTTRDDLFVQVREYIDDLILLADSRSSEITSVSIFGSAAKNGLARSVSDVDLIVALADEVPPKTKRSIGSELDALEVKHKFRTPPASRLDAALTVVDAAAGQFLSHFVCYRSDLLSGDRAAVFGVNPLAEMFLFSAHIAFANIVTSARVIWGEDLLDKIPIPTLHRRHLAKNCVSFLMLSAGALLCYPILPNATKYSMSTLKWMLHGCYFCYTLTAATVEEEIDFFQTKVEASKLFSELLTLRWEYQPSLGFIIGCFRVLIQLYIVTVRENKFPITVRVK